MRRPGVLVIPLLVGLGVWSTGPGSAQAQTPEYEVKAVILERLTDFVEWPSSTAEEEPFVIGVYGGNPFGSLLEDAYTGSEIGGRPVSVRYPADSTGIATCDVLFIANGDGRALESVLAYTRGRAILTVSDSDGFAERGVLVNLELVEGRIQIVINEDAVRESGLRFSHLLLGMARIVNASQVPS